MIRRRSGLFPLQQDSARGSPSGVAESVAVGGGRAGALRFEKVSKLYPGAPQPAVDDVTLAVEPGALVVILGPSGCGKTTLLKLVNRLVEPSSGQVFVDGQPVTAGPVHELRRRMGYVIQQIGLFPHLRVEQNVAVVPELLKWEKARISTRVDELLTLVGLPPGSYRRRYPGLLSGGEQQRVGLARALAGDPTMLLMDEPFGALDALTRARLQAELLRIHARLAQTVLFVTHDVDEALRLADQIVVMNEGRVVQFASPATVVLEPAGDFVAGLVGSGDVLRRLGMMPATAALKPLDVGVVPHGPAIGPGENLRTALAALLNSRAPVLRVLDADGRVVGLIDLESIHTASGAPTAGPIGTVAGE